MRLLLSLFLFSFTTLLAIVDIATIDFKEKEEGLSGSAYGSFQKKRGNIDKDEAEYGGRIQYDSDKTVTWLQGEVEKDRASGVLTDDNAFVHLRHIHQMHTQEWATEYYAQLKKERFKKIERRALWGAGIRYRVMNSDRYGKLFFGVSALDERIEYISNEPDPDEHNYRLSSYISYKTAVNKVFDLAYHGYYQPKFDNGSDYVTSSMAEMTIHLTEVFDLSYLIEFDYDTKPAQGVENRDLVQKLSFIYRFGEDDPFSSYAHSFLKPLDQREDTNISSDTVAAKSDMKADRVEESRDVLAGEWTFLKEKLSISLDGTGSYLREEGIYDEKLRWKIISTEAQEGASGAKKGNTKLVVIHFVDEEGRADRVENYLWNDNTLISLSDSGIRAFKR